MGPMKGYLCRVLAVYRSEITVKLDSHREILRGLALVSYSWFYFRGRLHLCCNFSYVLFFAVKCEHLSKVHGESSAVSLGYAFKYLLSLFYRYVFKFNF